MKHTRSNCCDYDAIVHYSPGDFCSRFKTELAGKILEIPSENSLPEGLAQSFANKYYRYFINTEALTLYRVFGQIARSNNPEERIRGAQALGGFASTEFAESVIDAKMRLALNPAWLNTKWKTRGLSSLLHVMPKAIYTQIRT